MAEDVSQLDSQRLDAALATWTQWQPRPVQPPRVLSRLGGESNDSFLVSDGSARWVLRVNATGPILGVNRRTECAVHRAAAQAGIAPTVAFSTQDYLVTPYLCGEPVTLVDLYEIGALLSRVHALPVELPTLDPLAYLDENLQGDLSAQLDPSLSECTLVDDCVQWLKNRSPTGSITFTPSHNDCLLANMIKTERGLMLIDWEYACAMDPAFDLAAVCASNRLSGAQQSQLVKGYSSQTMDSAFLERLAYYQYYYRLVELLWWRRRGDPKAAQLAELAREMLAG